MTEERAEQRRMTISDPQVMRALAHPVRLEIMEHLSSTGAAVTATECAEVVGLSPSATSYHLRALARFGLVEAAPSRGDARERLWRTTVGSWAIHADQDAAPETLAAEETLVEAFVARNVEQVRAWMRRSRGEPREWYDAAMMNGSVLLLTAEELPELNAAVLALLEPYKRRRRLTEPPVHGARNVTLHYAALPLD